MNKILGDGLSVNYCPQKLLFFHQSPVLLNKMDLASCQLLSYHSLFMVEYIDPCDSGRVYPSVFHWNLKVAFVRLAVSVASPLAFVQFCPSYSKLNCRVSPTEKEVPYTASLSSGNFIEFSYWILSCGR